jgi:hypothetical protein
MKRPNVIPDKKTVKLTEVKKKIIPTNVKEVQTPEAEVIPVLVPQLAIADPNIKVDATYKEHNVEQAVQSYDNSIQGNGAEAEAIRQMQERTKLQLEARNLQLQKNKEATEKYQTQFAEAEQRKPVVEVVPEVKPVKKAEIKAPVNTTKVTNLTMTAPKNNYIEELSQPQFNTAFDLIPLPSEGKLYKNKKANVKVAYMTTADENILTSPNLIQSGEFLEILINRKLLESDLRYKDLHVGDRSAIMLWLRATSYGEMYPVTLLDENNVPFETEIDLTSLKSKHLGDTPDAEGLFDFFLPVSKASIKFRLLNVGDLEEIELLMQEDKEAEDPVNHHNTYVLERQIVEVNGERGEEVVDDFVKNLRVKDGSVLKKHIDSIESGIDLELTVPTPGGGSVKTFFPLNISFFWPDFAL